MSTGNPTTSATCLYGQNVVLHSYQLAGLALIEVELEPGFVIARGIASTSEEAREKAVYAATRHLQWPDTCCLTVGG